MEQVIPVKTKEQFDRVEELLVQDGYPRLLTNAFNTYKENTYLHAYNSNDKRLNYGKTTSETFNDYEYEGLVVSYESFIEHHAKKINADQNDVVNHPNHYNSYSREVIDTIQGDMTSDEFKGYLKGNIIKYISRYQFKNGAEDLKKAEWYLAKLRDTVESEF